MKKNKKKKMTLYERIEGDARRNDAAEGNFSKKAKEGNITM